MPPKKPIAKPKPVARRGAAAAADPQQQPGDAPTTTGGESSTSTSSSSTAAAPEVFMAPIAPMAPVAPMAPPAPPPAEPAAATSEPSSTTPAPVEAKEAKPIPPPKGRLDSLTSSSRGGLGGIRGGASKLKFQPKVVQRRTREERENLDAKFQAEQAAAAAAEGSERPRGGGSGTRGARGGRGGRGRGRGGRGGFDMPVGASGPFALGSIVTAGRQKVMAECGPNFVKSSRSFSSYKSRIKSEGAGGEDSKQLGYSSSEESDGQRMDVEYISLLDDNPSEDEDGDKNMDNEWGAGAPIRVPRSEHTDRQVLVNTDSSSKKGKAELKAMKEKEMTFETDIKIKDEPEDDDVMLPPSSPELSKQKVKISESSPERKKKQPGEFSSPKKPRSKKKQIISTTEEKEEFERIEIDKMHALHELGGGPTEPVDAKDKAKDTEGDVDMLSPTAPKRNTETENQIFFFQFPPLLPHLVPMNTPTKEPKPEDPDVKPEPSSAAPTKKSILKGKALLKSQLALLTAPPPPGLVGKLRVHKSGRISLLWGNPDENGEGVMEMEVNRGAPCEFLQEVVVMKDKSPYGDQDVDEKGRPKGVAYSLGQVKGKYVVSPDFAELIKASNGKKSTTTGKGKEKEKKVEIVVDE